MGCSFSLGHPLYLDYLISIKLFYEMVLYKLTDQIYDNRLACKKALKISCTQYKKLLELGVLIPINKEDVNINPPK